MSRLHTNWSRSLLREKSASKPEKQESEDNKILVPTGGLDILKTLVVAKKISVPITDLYYYYEEKNGKRILQRFYSRGAQMKFPNEDHLRDVVFDIYPRFPEGYIVPLKINHRGNLVVEVPSTNNIFKFSYVHPNAPETSSVRVEFVITPDFVTFDGVKAVDPNAKEDEQDESEEG